MQNLTVVLEIFSFTLLPKLSYSEQVCALTSDLIYIAMHIVPLRLFLKDVELCHSKSSDYQTLETFDLVPEILPVKSKSLLLKYHFVGGHLMLVTKQNKLYVRSSEDDT